MNQTDFYSDIRRGKVGEEIFKHDFLDFLEIEYEDVTNCQKFQVIDTDFRAKIGTYEIKTSYKDDKILCIEEYTNVNEDLGRLSLGWFYKSGADLMVFISKKTHIMVLVPMTERFKIYYETIKNDFKLIRNRPTVKGNNKWQSAFRRIPLDSMKGHYSMYKRISQ